MFFATSMMKRAPTLSKWFFSIQPKRSVPPIDVSTMRFLISQEPIFQGVNRGSSLESTGILLTAAWGPERSVRPADTSDMHPIIGTPGAQGRPAR